jgi:hypothetical protein
MDLVMELAPAATDPLSSSEPLGDIENPFLTSDKGAAWNAAPAETEKKQAVPTKSDNTPDVTDAFEEVRPIVQNMSCFQRTCPTPYKYYRLGQFYCGKLMFGMARVFVACVCGLVSARPEPSVHFRKLDMRSDGHIEVRRGRKIRARARCVNVTLAKSMDGRELSIEFDHAAWNVTDNLTFSVMCGGICVDGQPTAYECSSNLAAIVPSGHVRVSHYSIGGIMLSFDDSAPIGMRVRGTISGRHCQNSTPLPYSLFRLAYFRLSLRCWRSSLLSSESRFCIFGVWCAGALGTT